MTKEKAKSKPSWATVKAKLATMDRLALVGLIQDLYAADKDNQVFLHTRFGLGGDVLKPYKAAVLRWVYPNVLRDQDVSVTKAKQAIADYKKAIGDPAGLADLMVYYCEAAAEFSTEYGMDDESYFGALVRMFEQAVKIVLQLSPDDRDAMIGRLDRVRTRCHRLGYGVGDDMDYLLEAHLGE